MVNKIKTEELASSYICFPESSLCEEEVTSLRKDLGRVRGRRERGRYDVNIVLKYESLKMHIIINNKILGSMK